MYVWDKVYIPESKGSYRYLVKVKKTFSTSVMQAMHCKVGTLKCTAPQRSVDHRTNFFLCCGFGFIEFIDPAFQVDADSDPRFGYQKMKKFS
jgi:hypothetical protein